MSDLTLWKTDKTVVLTGDRSHRHSGASVAPTFNAPPLIPQIQFSPTALAAAIARTATLRTAPPELIARLADSVLSDAEMLIAEGPGFALSPLLATFVDIEQTHFAGRIGAGITDLYMNALGYSWRDNATILSSSLNPHGDFIYHGGNAEGHGVVLAEARGSFASRVSNAAMARAAQQKYLRQVRPYIGVKSTHGDVIHGYALAFGCKPGMTGAFLNLSQTRRNVPAPFSSPTRFPPSLNRVPAPLALATQRSNFILMNALSIADWIDWLKGSRDVPEDANPVAFVRFGYGGRTFLASADALMQFYSPYRWTDEFLDNPWLHQRWRRRWATETYRLDWFVMEEKAATGFLNTLAGMIRRGPGTLPDELELSTTDIQGFSTGAELLAGADRPDFRTPGEAYDYALFRDGLALLGQPPPRRFGGIRIWHPREGLGQTRE
jgi:hypothetical protein